MTRKHLWLTAILLALACAPAAFAETESPADELKDLINQNLNALQGEDFDIVLSVIHSQSPVYLRTKTQVPPLFENFDLKYELMTFKYIGLDEDYAFASAKVKTTKIAGPAFQNREVDLMSVYRLENGQWKFWSQTNLETKYLND